MIDGSAGQPIAIGHAEGRDGIGQPSVPGRWAARRERVENRRWPDAYRRSAPGGQYAAKRVPHSGYRRIPNAPCIQRLLR